MYTNDGTCFRLLIKNWPIGFEFITLVLGFSHVSYMIHDTILLKWPTLLSMQQHFSDCVQFYCQLQLQLQSFLGICLSMTEMQGESVIPMAEDSKRVSLPASI